MYIKIPSKYGLPMRLIKKYKHFALFEDQVYGIRETFQYWDLTHTIIDGKIYSYSENGELIPTEKLPPVKMYKKTNKTTRKDNRLSSIIERYSND